MKRIRGKKTKDPQAPFKALLLRDIMQIAVEEKIQIEPVDAMVIVEKLFENWLMCPTHFPEGNADA